MKSSILHVISLSIVLSGCNAKAQSFTPLERADALIAEGNYTQAELFLAEAVEDNPYNGFLWLYYGVALEGNGNCTAAIQAWDRAIETGVNGDRNGMIATLTRRARCLASSGMIDAALADLETVHWKWGRLNFDSILSDEVYSDIVEDERFQFMVTGSPGQGDRDAGWLRDIGYLDEMVRRRHPHGTLITESDLWTSQISSLRESIQEMNNLEMVGALMNLVNLVGDGHSVLYPPTEGPLAFHLLPARVYRFEDGWKVIAADEEHSVIVGGTLTAVNGVPIEEVETRVHSFTGEDNLFSDRWFGETVFQAAELNALATGQNQVGDVVWTVETGHGEVVEATLSPTPIMRDPMSVLPPQEWVSVHSDEVPLWLSQPDTPYWMTTIWNGNGLYVQINQVADSSEESFADFGARIAESIGEAEAVILDLRHNRGGNGFLIEGFMRHLDSLDITQQRGRFYVLTGRSTFSAAGELTGHLARSTQAIFVGEPTGSRPTVFGTDTVFELPFSGLVGSISSHLHINGVSSDDARPWFSPDIYAPVTIEALQTGRDPALEAILSLRPE